MSRTNEAKAITLARKLAEEFATRAGEADRLGQLPLEDVQALRDSGYLSMSVPKAYGGQELSMKTCLEAQLELAQGSASTAIVSNGRNTEM